MSRSGWGEKDMKQAEINGLNPSFSGCPALGLAKLAAMRNAKLGS